MGPGEEGPSQSPGFSSHEWDRDIRWVTKCSSCLDASNNMQHDLIRSPCNRDLKSNFEVELSRLTYICFDSSPPDKQEGQKLHLEARPLVDPKSNLALMLRWEFNFLSNAFFFIPSSIHSFMYLLLIDVCNSSQENDGFPKRCSPSATNSNFWSFWPLEIIILVWEKNDRIVSLSFFRSFRMLCRFFPTTNRSRDSGCSITLPQLEVANVTCQIDVAWSSN